MKFSVSWLKDYLETNASVEEITSTLTQIGLEVESVENKATLLKPFKVVMIEEAKPHPEADRLQICSVSDGEKTYQIVCGAPNARKGLKSVLAPLNTYVPGLDQVLKPVKIRGVESQGMLCSWEELALSAPNNDNEGIIECVSDIAVGMPLVEWLDCDDTIIEIAVTPNRGDCLGIYGIARDLAAAGLGTLKEKPKTNYTTAVLQEKTPIRVHFDQEASYCQAFGLRLIKNVKNGPSPEWLQKKMNQIGLKSISALVDVTNYVMLAFNRPLHVFDADSLKGDLYLRMARANETLLALDNETYKLDETIGIIADEERVVSIGGIMGGLDTGCTNETHNVLVECAWFQPEQIAGMARKLGILSDARYRFERGVDPHSIEEGLDLATSMILELCGGAPLQTHIYYANPHNPLWQQKQTIFRPKRFEKLIGYACDEKQACAQLERLGCKIDNTNLKEWQVTLPSWRRDLQAEIDLIEEVTRLNGVDKIIPEMVSAKSTQEIVPLMMRKRYQLMRLCAALGFKELVTWSFVSEKQAHTFSQTPQDLAIKNPISVELGIMRPHILPNLLQAVKYNLDHHHHNLAFFECGPQFFGREPGQQTLCLAGVRVGQTHHKHWHVTETKFDAHTLKQDVFALLTHYGLDVNKLRLSEVTKPWYHPGQAVTINLGNKEIAACGKIHPKLQKEWDIKQAVYAFELYLEALPPLKAQTTKPLFEASPYPPVVRDFAFVVAQNVTLQDMIASIKKAEKTYIKSIDVFDVYQGSGVKEGYKSVALSVVFSSLKHTFADQEIEILSTKICQQLAKDCNAELRS